MRARKQQKAVATGGLWNCHGGHEGLHAGTSELGPMGDELLLVIQQQRSKVRNL